MVVNIMIVMILVACGLVTGEPVEETKIVTNPSEPNKHIWAEIQVLQKNYANLLKNYTRDITNIKHVFSGTPFTTCKGEPVISLTGTKIKYPATGEYSPFEKCEWTIDAGKVTISFAHFDMELTGMHDFVEIWKDGSRVYQLNQERYNANPDISKTLDGVLTIKFISDNTVQGTGFEMNISDVE